MFILPSRSRPHNLRRLVDAWVRTDASSPVELCIDSDDPCRSQYESMPLPSKWHIFTEERAGLSRVYNNAYSRYPNEPYYGFIADDVVPLTNSWDSILIEAAGSNGMAVPAGGHDPNGAPHFVLGGDLVRTMGWLALPGLDRLYIDTVWATLAESKGVMRHCRDVVLKHLHFSNGLALFDATYRKSREVKENDKRIYEEWLINHRGKTSQSNRIM